MGALMGALMGASYGFALEGGERAGCLRMPGRGRERRAPARRVARSRRQAGGGLAPAVPRRRTPRKKWPVSLGCRGLLRPPDGVWDKKTAPRDNGRKLL
jgi:hypothetical protein